MAMTIQELREKRKKVWDTARDFLDCKRNANGVLSEEDSKTYDAMEQTIVDLGKEIHSQPQFLRCPKRPAGWHRRRGRLSCAGRVCAPVKGDVYSRLGSTPHSRAVVNRPNR